MDPTPGCSTQGESRKRTNKGPAKVEKRRKRDEATDRPALSAADIEAPQTAEARGVAAPLGRVDNPPPSRSVSPDPLSCESWDEATDRPALSAADIEASRPADHEAIIKAEAVEVADRQGQGGSPRRARCALAVQPVEVGSPPPGRVGGRPPGRVGGLPPGRGGGPPPGRGGGPPPGRGGGPPPGRGGGPPPGRGGGPPPGRVGGPAQRTTRRKRFRFTDHWRDDPDQVDPMFSFTSFGSSNVNILQSKDRFILLECGKLRRTPHYDLYERYTQTEFLSADSEPSYVGDIIDADQEELTILKALERNRDIFRRFRSSDLLVVDMCRKLRESLGPGPKIFQCIVISSPEENCWNCLHALLLDEDGHAFPDISVQCIVLHGNPQKYSKTFIAILSILLEEYSPEIWFTSYSFVLNDLTILQDLRDSAEAVASPLYFHSFDPHGRPKYIDTRGYMVVLPFQEFLSIGQTVRVTFLALNHFHLPMPIHEGYQRSTWHIPDCRTNQDSLPISVHLATQRQGFSPIHDPSIFRVFLSSDCTRAIFRLLRSAHIANSDVLRHDIISFSHNGVGDGQEHQYSTQEFFRACEGRICVIPSGDTYHYPRKHVHTGIMDSCVPIEPHRYVYFAKTTDDDNVTHFYRKPIEMQRGVFSLHVPLHMKFHVNLCSIRQNSQRYIDLGVPASLENLPQVAPYMPIHGNNPGLGAPIDD